jgi:hypothetical protein
MGSQSKGDFATRERCAMSGEDALHVRRELF